jgi:hypothetical protein
MTAIMFGLVPLVPDGFDSCWPEDEGITISVLATLNTLLA